MQPGKVAQDPSLFATPFRAWLLCLSTIKMASPTPFYKIICLVICVGLAWFSVVAKPIELPALSQRRYMSNSSQIVDAVEGARNDGTHSVNNYLPKTWTIATPPCLDHGHCASGYVVADIAPNMHTLTWSVWSYNQSCHKTS